MRRPFLIRMVLAACALAAAGCDTSAHYVASRPPPSNTGYVARIRIESVVNGGGIKVNGMYVDDLPGYAAVEVDRTGKVDRIWVIGLSTNILAGVQDTVTLEPGQAVPAKIFFNRTGPEITGSAVVITPR